MPVWVYRAVEVLDVGGVDAAAAADAVVEHAAQEVHEVNCAVVAEHCVAQAMVVSFANVAAVTVDVVAAAAAEVQVAATASAETRTRDEMSIFDCM